MFFHFVSTEGENIKMENDDFVCLIVVWKGESCSAESRPEETRPSLKKVRTDKYFQERAIQGRHLV